MRKAISSHFVRNGFFLCNLKFFKYFSKNSIILNFCRDIICEVNSQGYLKTEYTTCRQNLKKLLFSHSPSVITTVAGNGSRSPRGDRWDFYGFRKLRFSHWHIYQQSIFCHILQKPWKYHFRYSMHFLFYLMKNIFAALCTRINRSFLCRL